MDEVQKLHRTQGMQRMSEFLLKNANPSIVYRVKKEILQDISEEEEDKLQKLILSEKLVQSILECQKENGWLGNGFHGSNKNAGQFTNMEAGVKYLAEKGVNRETEVLKRAMIALKELPSNHPYYRGAWNVGDEFKYAANGGNLFRCACIARGGYEDYIDISPQIQLALDSFHRVLEVDSILDVTYLVKRGTRRVFRDFEKWPCRYHLDILAHTNGWRSEENSRMLAQAIHKLMRTDCPELVGVKADSWVGHVLATCGCFPSQGFSLVEDVDGISYYHLEYLIWLARCGVVLYIPTLREITEKIWNSVNEEGVCDIAVHHSLFKDWGTYAGLQLEVDWKSKVRRNCDITFRALQLCYYAGEWDNER